MCRQMTRNDPTPLSTLRYERKVLPYEIFPLSGKVLLGIMHSPTQTNDVSPFVLPLPTPSGPV